MHREAAGRAIDVDRRGGKILVEIALIKPVKRHQCWNVAIFLSPGMNDSRCYLPPVHGLVTGA
jgi:hypothetical protein